MLRITRRMLCAILITTAFTGCELGAPEPTPERLLVFTKTAGYRHTSIPAAIFNAVSLQRFDAVLFLSTTGDILDSAQQVAFENFVKAGGGFIGVHSATDTEYDWTWYGGLVGAYFKSHPAIQAATINVTGLSHPATEGMAASSTRTDEWYDFLAQPVGVTVLVTVDEATYTGGTMGATHPVSWHHVYDGGRAFYTAMGHTEESYAESAFLAHLAGAIRWAMNLD